MYGHRIEVLVANLKIYCFDSKTNQPIPAISLQITGSTVVTALSGTNGYTTVTLQPGSWSVTGWGTTYPSVSQSVVLGNTDQVVDLAFAQTSQVPVTLSIQAIFSSQPNFSTNTNLNTTITQSTSETITLDSIGRGNSNKTYAPSSSVQITISSPDYTQFSKSYTVPASGIIQVGPLLSPVATTITAPSGTSVLPSPPTIPASSYNFTYPTGEVGKYFTLAQVRLYIGTLFIDELESASIMLQSNKVPIYGYASTYFDAVGRGRSLVNGTLTLNYISEGYLYTVLNEYAKANSTTSLSNAAQSFLNSVNTQTALASVNTTKSGSTLGDGNSVNTITAIPGANQTSQYNTLLAQQRMVAASAGPQIFQELTSYITPSLDGTNAVDMDVAFDMVFEANGAGRTTTRTVQKVILTGNQTIYSDDGRPVSDQYSFIARRYI